MISELSGSTPVDEEVAGPPRPLSASGRISVLDFLRGIAIMGILVSNIQDFGGYPIIPVNGPKPVLTGPHAALDTALLFAQQVLFYGKTRGLLGMLFGAGALLLTERITARRGRHFADAIFVRRHAWLIVLGLLHAFFIWHGDYLMEYGAVGLFVLFWCRGLGTKTLLVVGALFSVTAATCGPLLYHGELGDVVRGGRVALASVETALEIEPGPTGKRAVRAWRSEQTQTIAPEVIRRTVEQGRSGYGARLEQNIPAFLRTEALYALLGALDIVGPMLLGMAALRIGFLTGELPVRVYAWTAILGASVSIPLTVLGVWAAVRDGLTEEAVACFIYLPIEFVRFGTVLAVIALSLLWVRSRRATSVTRAIAAVGQMAVSNYLLTSVVCQWLFAWGPWKLYGALDYDALYGVVVCVWIINLLSSRIWLNFFLFGPVEWVWRSLTYGEMPAMIRGTAPP